MITSSQQKLALVIPTLNESGNIPVLLGRLGQAVRDAPVDCEFIIVDDDSQDGTQEIVEKCAAQDPRVRLLVRKGKKGLAGAVIHGWENTAADLLGVMDADLQHPPEVLPQLLEPVMNGSDISIASRYAVANTDSVSDWHKLRLLISRASTAATACSS